MHMITAIAGTACLLYYVIISLYAGLSADFGWFWLALGTGFWLVTLFGRMHRPAYALCGRILFWVLLAGIVVLAAESVQVIAGMRDGADAEPEYVIVLGAQVKGTRPSKALAKRLEKADAYAREHPAARFILSGGQGENEDISEAQCMYEYLTQRGIGKERLILEDRSVSTRENLLFSDELSGCAQTACGILSNNFHICRALKLARTLGYKDPVGIPAASDPIMQVHYVVREAAALAVMSVRGAA